MSKLQKNEIAAEYDRIKVQTRLNGFDSENSIAYKYLREISEHDFKHFELLKLAKYLAKRHPCLKIDREAKRRKSVLIKWYDENFDVLKPFIDNLAFEDKDHEFYGLKKNELKRLSITD